MLLIQQVVQSRQQQLQFIGSGDPRQQQSFQQLQQQQKQVPQTTQIQAQLVQGPGVDLVALNRRRFELDHSHDHNRQHGETASDDLLRRGEFIESKLAAIPDRLLSQLPDDLSRQLIESFAADPGLVLAGSSVGQIDSADDPDGASIERLTKSCLTVQASSATAEQLNVTFHLFTRQNRHAPHILRPQVTRLELIKGSPFDPTKPVKWITHGFHTNLDKSEWMLEAKNKILEHEEANVILTDWRRGASPALAFYPKAAANAHIVAKMIVKILLRLKSDLDLSRVHLIGHSLGAHIMGFVGSAFTEEYLSRQQQLLAGTSSINQEFWRDLPATIESSSSRELIGRITACDPALPCFGPSSSAPNSKQSSQGPVAGRQQPIVPPTSSQPNAHGDPFEPADRTPTMWTHLRPDSAVVVEVMHSNPGVMGYADPLGDFDFYPNGFERQPGCGSRSEPAPAPQAPRATDPMSRSLNPIRHIAKLAAPIKTLVSTGRGLSQSLAERFIKPIRDFFTGYTCSHHRAVEYMVESMYYERVPRDRKLDRDLVCQMVGYRCADYKSFKRGFCFKCRHELDCRAFVMSTITATSLTGASLRLADVFDGAQSAPSLLIVHDLTSDPAKDLRPPLPPATATISGFDKFRARLLELMPHSEVLKTGEQMSSPSVSTTTTTPTTTTTTTITKRVLPTFNHYRQNYKPPKRNQYYFDTRPTRDFCLHHYHMFVKYRWFRIRESVTVENFKLSGTLGSIGRTKQQQPASSFHRFTHQSYTMLLTHPHFLGQIESLLIFGDNLKSSQIEYIEVSYLSNLDAQVRSLGSGRLCRSSQAPLRLLGQEELLRMVSSTELPSDDLNGSKMMSSINLFVRCSGPMVR